jgi:3alpha(or 20beta)-hydroxysteroid dehydrogenase
VSERLEGKVALISGGARGQGEAEARRFVAEGAKVVIGDLLDDEGKTVAESLGPDCTYVHLDVTDEQSWIAAVDATVATYGGVTILVNNAGILGEFKAITRTTLDEYMKVVMVNQVGTFLGIKSVARPMAASGGGSIVNISSLAGMEGNPFQSGYTSSKWAVRGLTKSAAMELGPRGIRVNSVHPGGVDTPMIDFLGNDTAMFYKRLPIARVGTVDDVANMVLFLASDESAYSTGAEFIVDGGSSAGNSGLFDTQ